MFKARKVIYNSAGNILYVYKTQKAPKLIFDTKRAKAKQFYFFQIQFFCIRFARGANEPEETIIGVLKMRISNLDRFSPVWNMKFIKAEGNDLLCYARENVNGGTEPLFQVESYY